MITNSMQQRAGLLFLAKNTGRFLLIHEDKKWTVPTFERKTVLLDDAEPLLLKFSRGKIVPIELYLSADRGFEYSTYVCLVDQEFLVSNNQTFSWVSTNDIPKNLHNGLKNTLENSIIKTKIETILELEK
jgi:hypothetical protein